MDFSDLQPDSQLTLVNTAGAPFDGQPFPAARAAEAANLEQLLPYPDVMRFRAVAGPSTRRPRPERLATDLTAPTREDLSGAVRRAVALVEQELEDMPNMLTMRELFQAPRHWVKSAYHNLIYFNEADRGGHFAAWEEPELFATEMRAAFRSLR